MVNNITRTRNLALLLSVSAAVVAMAMGCGKNNSPAPATPPVAVPIPQVPVIPPPPNPCQNGFMFNGVCQVGPSFETACYNSGGAPIIASGRSVCKWDRMFVPGWSPFYPYSSSWVTLSSFPLLTPGDTAGRFALNTGITVRPGDRVISDFVGYWGVKESESRTLIDIGGFFVIRQFSWSLDCRDISLDGFRDYDSDPFIYQGQRAGLMGTDGAETFFLGEGGSKVISHNGILKVGINAPLFEAGVGCGRFESGSHIHVEHCEDALGITYLCP